MNVTHEKVWQFSKNNGSFYSIESATVATNATESTKRLHLLQIDIWTGFPSNPWVLESNGNSTSVENNTGVRLLNTPADIVNATGAHSWYVLRNPVTGVQLCWDFVSATTHMLTFVFSPAAGFGSVNGGADGTTTARPTATDEIVIHTSTYFDSAIVTTNNMITGLYNVMHSEDGECTRVIMPKTGTEPIMMHALFVETPKRPHPSWSPARAVWLLSQLNYASVSPGSISSGTLVHGFFRDSTLGSSRLRMSGLDWNGERGPAATTGKYALIPLMMDHSGTGESATFKGFWGGFYDMGLIAMNAVARAVIPSGLYLRDNDDEVRYVSCENLWLPWSGPEPMISSSGFAV